MTRLMVGRAAEALPAGVPDCGAPVGGPMPEKTEASDGVPIELAERPVEADGPVLTLRGRLGAGSGEAEGTPPAAAGAVPPPVAAPGIPGRFLQSRHLHTSEHGMAAWKHSQYFLRHPDFLQWHPLLCRIAWSSDCLIFGRKACGLRSSVCAIAFFRLSSFSGLLWQPWQLHAKQ